MDVIAIEKYGIEIENLQNGEKQIKQKVKKHLDRKKYQKLRNYITSQKSILFIVLLLSTSKPYEH